MAATTDYFCSDVLMSRSSSPHLSDDEDLDAFFDNYIPLQSFPTPPLSAQSTNPPSLTSESSSPLSPLSPIPIDYQHLIVPATYFSHLIPSSASPSPSTIALYLARASLPDESVALAATLLDSLSSSFARSWRAAITAEANKILDTCENDQLKPTLSSSPCQSPTLSSPAIQISVPSTFTITRAISTTAAPTTATTTIPTRRKPLHTRTASLLLTPLTPPPADAILLAALKIAASFLDDLAPRQARWWTAHVSRGRVTDRELEGTVRCMLQDIEYDLCGVAEEEGVERWRRVLFRGAPGSSSSTGAGASVNTVRVV